MSPECRQLTNQSELNMYLSIATLPTAEAAVFPCQDGDADLFFSESPVELERAKALCSECPLRAECLEGALQRAEPWGVWGGEIFQSGRVLSVKRGRGRPRKAVA